MTLDEINRAVGREYLEIFGGFHTSDEDNLPGIGTVLMLGPKEPGFWAHVAASPEFSDNEPDPLDRWSLSTIASLADTLKGSAYFPFGEPPYRPFIGWAIRTGQAWTSEVGLLVHDRAGLMVSYRGAIGLAERLDLPAAGVRPCDSCGEKPCLTACPVGALTDEGYGIPACKSYVSSMEGEECRSAGCRVRRVCPAGQNYGRLPDQSAHHMRYFLG